MKSFWIAFLGLVLAGGAQAADTAARLKADLLANTSATAVLGQWCAAGHLADPPVIKAVRTAADMAPSPEVRALLKASADEPIRYRRVKLMCGSHVLSEADNWYLPSRLTPEMNAILDTTDMPFGTAVKALDFHRKTLNADAVSDSHTILRVRALLLTPDERPFSLVVENYSDYLKGGSATPP